MSREYKHSVDGSPHVLAYVKRSKVMDWKRLMIPRSGKAFPFDYGSSDKNVFAKKVKKDYVLWVVGATSDKRPPSLVAKLHVIGRVDDPGGETFGVPEAVLRSFRDQFKYIALQIAASLSRGNVAITGAGERAYGNLHMP